MAKQGLGRGIDALLQGSDMDDFSSEGSVKNLPVEDVVANPEQPRKHFSDDALTELADSIREKGVIQPLLVEEQPDGTYQIVAGERRYRASKLAGITTVPAIVRSFSPDEKLEIALIENIQREDLSAIEEAKAYKSLMETSGLNQEALAKRLGKNRSTVANAVRLLKLPPVVQTAIDEGKLSAGHARAILQAGSEEAMEQLFQRIMEDGLSVRFAEALARGEQIPGMPGYSSEVNAARKVKNKTSKGDDDHSDLRKTIELMNLEEQLIMQLGTKVIVNGSEEKGKIEISYYSMDDLNRLMDLLLPKESSS